jgi:ArsR family metal-binding transcriptional regulator
MQTTLLELFGYSSKEEVIGKTTRIKAIYGTGKISVDNIINQANEVIKDFEVNYKKKEIRFGYQHLC